MSWAEVKKINSNLDVPLDELLKGGGTSVVKSVQRGVSSVSGPGGSDITISPVDLDKSVLITNYRPGARDAYFKGWIKDSTHVYLAQNAYASDSIPWQVIEFY